MQVKTIIDGINADFFAGVPDSLLNPLCSYLVQTYGTQSRNHIIAANEGNAVALAAGYHLATGKTPVVYLQNSGLGNIINPVASLMNDKIYGIPCVFFVGWRGEPGVHDEPQHLFQGEVTLKLLEDMDIRSFVIRKDTTAEELVAALSEFDQLLAAGKQVAFAVCKGALEYDGKVKTANTNPLRREEIIRTITDYSQGDIIISTTGKASRELFELREAGSQGHGNDLLTVGSMGHSSSIALSVALQKPHTRVWCIDGDGAVLMHMGAMAIIGSKAPSNLIHVMINNGAHESVGGMPTVADSIDWPMVAQGCGYRQTAVAATKEELCAALEKLSASDELCFLEVKAAIGARDDLGRPTIAPVINKENLMKTLNRKY